MLSQILLTVTYVLIGAVSFNLITLYSVWSGANFIRTGFSKSTLVNVVVVLSLLLCYNSVLLLLLESGSC